MEIDNKYLFDYSFFEEPKKFKDLLLYQIGEIFCDDRAVVESHVHKNLFELTCVISGKGVIYAGNECKEVGKNDVFISLPYERHEIISDPVSPIRYYYIAFSYEKDSEFYKILYDNSMLSLSGSMRVYHSASILNTFPTLISAFESYNLPYSDTYFELSIKLLTIDICRFYQQIYTQKYKSPTISGEQNLYYKIMKYIDNNLTKIDNLTEIADDLNYNYVYISRIFKQKFGESMYSYFSNKKLELAKKLIDEGNMTITEISEHLNYSSIYVFSRIFKKRYGISPNTYKQNK
ncbi:MAG: helix-turn-helix transcriptional regulator [Clostridia bacterium]|nr:helix-turn-helix transcriptional regulator [Clostridia bacterium]